MSTTADVTIAPNDKYRRVIGLSFDPEMADDVDPIEEWTDEERDAADDFQELVDNAPEPAEFGVDEDEMKTLSWDMISPASDPDLLAKIATYFEGMEPDEPADLLSAKCRLLDVDIYVDAQVAAREELRDN
ncbi:hypothetical protein NDI85_21100 [Halomicroarcula sp. S1AR25-4]|uniref:hypothetical protein n=1 Tax=Haloarcula sp. S1AR25-4 TaxID=2950538 RepID=UPI0028761405|nr:hypothetical protein [Halomicroarcula sp. S1AR25-4]MDS0280285.1 hypothetical protein [Halomicroarcula sp. S1AR25-4]